jgi:hypothetical protein
MVSLSLFWHFSMDAAGYLMRKSFAKDCDEGEMRRNNQYYIVLEILDSWKK